MLDEKNGWAKVGDKKYIRLPKTLLENERKEIVSNFKNVVNKIAEKSENSGLDLIEKRGKITIENNDWVEGFIRKIDGSKGPAKWR
jgi:16S rRNA A1518/A1519 N6-dimethyltransferase RsmA/KsgA/DIM1 with predicted DNA glycosylase/AP lyase activity